MKKILVLFSILAIGVTVTACASSSTANNPQPILVPTLAPSETPAPTLTGGVPIVEVSTADASTGGGIQVVPGATQPAPDQNIPIAIPADGITLADNNKTFIMHPGDRVLLNLGMAVYDWTVAIDDQSILSRVVNVAVIQGAQGLYEAHKPGQAILSAAGDPLCRQKKPACMMPSILYKVTILVQ